ncbi:CoA ester lyase [Variovorax sp. J22P168]|uniref:HpcH/HpaI aldolase/citrate lyase family protein n=1 Tax=Variovorax jilinensis TaxID=3053513 RepID=UPI0025771A9D|nr:CoA ester lyase [Variovorax sp. J22P168]MDM0015148.1 CoA ester lyase [Variovorax sp. J22P168]
MKTIKLRSMLFVPADSERKLTKSIGSVADALILDLEDSVADSRKIGARTTAADFIASRASEVSASLFVRINPLDTLLAMGDLASIVVPGLAGIMLPKTHTAADIDRLGHCLDALEARAGIEPGTVRIVPVATETPQAMLTMQSFAARLSERLAGITWGAEDLSAAIGAVSNRDDDGTLSPLYAWANSLCLCAAASSRVPAIDTLYADFRDPAGLAAACRASRRRGFRGRIAIHPDQVGIINEAYSPTETEIAHARRIVDAFEAAPEAGTLSIDGVMLDKPHLTQALETLKMAS